MYSVICIAFVFFFKQKTAYEMRIGDWSSDVCSSDLPGNNGSDGFVIARLLRDWGVAVRVAVTGESRTASAQKARAAWDGAMEDIATAMPATQLVDALFGTGLVRPLDEKLSTRLAYLTAAAKHSYAQIGRAHV